MDTRNGRRGREAQTPITMPKKGWRDIGIRVWNSLSAHHVSLVAAGIAFYGLLAIFPAIAALISIAGLVLDPAEVQAELSNAIELLPAEASSILTNQARDVASRPATGITLTVLFGLLLTLYSASSGIRNLVQGLNIIYDESEKRSFIIVYLLSLGLTLGIIIGFVVAVALVVILPSLLGFLGLGDTVVGLLDYLRWPFLALMAILGLGVLYRVAPSRAAPRWQWISVGSVVATLLWIIGSVGFSVYVSNFASYNETYGSLGAVVILLMWLWLSAFIVLLGAEINAQMEHQTAVDTTTGEPVPMGERGAVKADTLGKVP
jgi:membrane protein